MSATDNTTTQTTLFQNHDFTQFDGLGPQSQQNLNAHGIRTYKQFVDTNMFDIKEITGLELSTAISAIYQALDQLDGCPHCDGDGDVAPWWGYHKIDENPDYFLVCRDCEWKGELDAI
jgi:hypothetical protein